MLSALSVNLLQLRIARLARCFIGLYENKTGNKTGKRAVLCRNISYGMSVMLPIIFDSVTFLGVSSGQ